MKHIYYKLNREKLSASNTISLGILMNRGILEEVQEEEVTHAVHEPMTMDERDELQQRAEIEGVSMITGEVKYSPFTYKEEEKSTAEHAFDTMMGHPLEALEKLTVREEEPFLDGQKPSEWVNKNINEEWESAFRNDNRNSVADYFTQENYINHLVQYLDFLHEELKRKGVIE
jgi:hypothetical protein